LPYTLILNEDLFQFGVCINTIALSPDPASRALSHVQTTAFFERYV
jgi:hypothetical protein